MRAWAWFDAGAVLAEAERLDALRASGAPLGALHGLPVGVKDVIDTAGISTENGSPVDAGRVPREDAEAVKRLKEAGAIMFGKTVTTELAFLHPNKTRNPRNLEHTPGGSSSGSAAAVADGNGAAGHWHADRRLCCAPSLLLRHNRAQAQLQRDPAKGRAASVPFAGHARRLCKRSSGCFAPCKCSERKDSGSSGACRRPRFRVRGTSRLGSCRPHASRCI